MLGEYVTVSLNDQYIWSMLHIEFELYAIKLLNKILISDLLHTEILGIDNRHSRTNPFSSVEWEAK